MADMRELIHALAGQGQTILISSHLLGEVQELCDRVGVMSDGRLLAESTVAELRGTASLLVRAEPFAAAAAVASRVVGADCVSRVDNSLVLATDPRRAAELVRELVRADVAVLEVRPQERTLEDAFFALTEEATS
jgi:ABC-2 type transport system ATP-binding protein